MDEKNVINELLNEVRELKENQERLEREVDALKGEIAMWQRQMQRDVIKRRNFNPEENRAQILYGPPAGLRNRRRANNVNDSEDSMI